MPNQNTSLPIAVQLYTLRKLPQSLDDLLAQVAAIGYSGVETIGDHGISADEMKTLLNKHQLKAVSTHVSLQAMETDLEAIIAFNQAIGNNTLTIPALPQDERPADGEGWQQMGRRLDAVGQQCAAAGMVLLYHNHAIEMINYDGKLAIDWLLGAAEPEHLQWEPDLAWIVRGEADALALLERYAGRCPCIHVKDLAPEGQNEDEMGFADVGYGTLNWETLLSAAQAAGANWYIVEHDLPKDPVRTVERSYTYLEERLTTLSK